MWCNEGGSLECVGQYCDSSIDCLGAVRCSPSAVQPDNSNGEVEWAAQRETGHRSQVSLSTLGPALQYSVGCYSAVQCSAVQCSAVQCSAVQCSAVQCSAVQAVQCSSLSNF